jgi:hypothetical protein
MKDDGTLVCVDKNDDDCREKITSPGLFDGYYTKVSDVDRLCCSGALLMNRKNN